MDGLEPTNETGIEYHINSADEKAAAMRRILPDLAADSPLLTGTVDEMYEGLSRILPALTVKCYPSVNEPAAIDQRPAAR